jgi:hypothetical protein
MCQQLQPVWKTGGKPITKFISKSSEWYGDDTAGLCDKEQLGE